MVGVGVLEVYLLVCDVEVPTAHDRLLFGESGQEATVALVPQHALVEASQTVLRVRRVDIHEPVACELQGADATLVLCHGRSYLAHHLQGLLPAEDRRARVALALGEAPGLHVARDVKVHLPLLELGLLDGEDVCRAGVKDLGKAWLLLEYGAQAVYVPRYERELARVGV